MSRAARAVLGYFAGAALIAVGAGIEWGVDAGLIVAGVLLLVWSVLIYDVDAPLTEE